MEQGNVKRPAILWADDDPDEIAIMRELLSSFDNSYHIAEATNGQKVLDYLDAAVTTDTLPSLIVLDINMPVLNGKDTLARIKQNPALKSIPVVVFTTSSSPLDQNFCNHYYTEMISKPVTYTALKEVIRKLLRLCEVNTIKKSL